MRTVEIPSALIRLAGVACIAAGVLMMGISIVRAKVFPAWTGVAIAIGSLFVPVAYLAGLPVRAIAVAALIIAVGQVTLGYELLRR